VLLSQGLSVFAGEAADLVAGLIADEYYPALSEEEYEEIRKISGGPGDDNDKIEAMCAMLDPQTVYYPLGLPHLSDQEKTRLDYSVGRFLYIRINKFDFGIDDKVISLLDQYPDKPLLLDLSDCTGGVLTVMENIGKALVPGGVIYTAFYRDGKQTAVSRLATNSRAALIIVSGDTASCAEILAAALQESGTARILGGRTYGKASVQKVCVLPNGGVLKITVGHWLTRKGVDINGAGLSPDILLNRAGTAVMKRILIGGVM